MKLGERYLALSLVVGGLGGCFFVARPVHPATDVVVYSVHSPPPARPVGWRRSFQFHYYPSCQVYFAPHRNVYIWKGPRGWMTTPQPPPSVVIDQAEVINVEIENDDPVACHAEVDARARPIARTRRPQRAAEVSPRQPASAPEKVEVEVNVTVNDPDDAKDANKGRDGDRRDADKPSKKGKSLSKGKGKGKDKSDG